MIAAAAIGFLTACYLVYRFSGCCFKSKVAESIPEDKVEKKAAASVEKREMEILGKSPRAYEYAGDPFEEDEQSEKMLHDQFLLAIDCEIVDQSQSPLRRSIPASASR